VAEGHIGLPGAVAYALLDESLSGRPGSCTLRKVVDRQADRHPVCRRGAGRPTLPPSGRDARPMPLSGILRPARRTVGHGCQMIGRVAASCLKVEEPAESVRVTAAGLQLYRGEGRGVGVGRRQVHRSLNNRTPYQACRLASRRCSRSERCSTVSPRECAQHADSPIGIERGQRLSPSAGSALAERTSCEAFTVRIPAWPRPVGR
jgi:hypothetical protein